MTYRNDLEAAHARLESLERENRQLIEERARLRADVQACRTEPRDVHPATLWIVGIFGVFTAVIAAAVIAGY
jgi:hypothetical protein